MSCDRCIALLCLSAALTLALVQRSGAATVPTLGLDELGLGTICKTKVEYDQVDDRIPRIIKEVKCADEPDTMCPAHGGGGAQTSCCNRNSHDLNLFACKQLTDTVLVKYGDSDPIYKTVAVGCACAVQTVTEAVDAKW